jgi:hypothetical protein
MSSRNEVEVFRSDIPFEAEMIVEALEAENLPCALRRELPGGLQLTVLETMSPPGQWTVVLVPKEVAERARELISTFRPPGDLPDEPEDIEPFPTRRPRPSAVKKRAYASVLLLLLVVPFIIAAIVVLVALFD